MSVPGWLQRRLAAAGGAVPFSTYMDWVLHDPEHGAYGSGRLRIGPRGDFATAPSLGTDFAELLAAQLAEWLSELAATAPGPLALVEAGPGEGSLAADLAVALAAGWPALAARCELVLVEPNPGMAARQRRRLSACPLPCRWSGFAELASAPLRAVLLAHEVLDALPVERICWDGEDWRGQRVVLESGNDGGDSGGDSCPALLRLEAGEPLAQTHRQPLAALGLDPPCPRRPPGWTTELHPGLAPWLEQAAAALGEGWLLVIDYALEASRYYAPVRAQGTLMAYREQQASADPLQEPGSWDLTAHVCIESLEQAAGASGWQSAGHCRQGQALLALGLAERLHGLQQLPGAELAQALASREALLRLVDPHALGDFRWLAFARGAAPGVPRFLRDPVATF